MKQYNRVMCGKGSTYYSECLEEEYVGLNWLANTDLSGHLPENWRDFNREFIPTYLQEYPGKSKVAAGLACGMTWTLSKGLNVGDVVLCPDGDGNYKVGEIAGPYQYRPKASLCHQRPVRWFEGLIPRSSMSKQLQNSIGSIGSTSNCSEFAEEIESLMAGKQTINRDEGSSSFDGNSVFAMEKYLEEFLFTNWPHTELGRNWDLFKSDETEGRQVATEAGIIDLLAVSKDKKEYLVIELKRGRPSDEVVGQITRYMGYMHTVTNEGQSVKGLIIGLEDDSRIQHSLRVVPNIDFYKYEIDFKLLPLKV